MPTDISMSLVAPAESVPHQLRFGDQCTRGQRRWSPATVGLCFVPMGHLVPGDVMLAQKIALETNEVGALAVANRFPVQVPRRS